MTVRACALLLAFSVAPLGAAAAPVTIAIDWTRIGARIPDQLVGLSVSSALLGAGASGPPPFRLENESLLRMFRALGVRNLRIKGEGSIEAVRPHPRPADLDCLHWFAVAADADVTYGDLPAAEFCDEPARRFADSYAEARWILDDTYRRAEAGARELTFGTGERGCIPRALALALNAFHRGAHGRWVPVAVDNPADMELSAYAVLGDDESLWLTVIDQDGREADVALRAGRAVSAVLPICCQQGADVRPDGTTAATWLPWPASERLMVRAGSAMLVRFRR